MTDPDIFRLHGQSLAMYGSRKDTQLARHRVHQCAIEDGYTAETLTHLSVVWFSRKAAELAELVSDRLRENPELRSYSGDSPLWFFLGNPHQMYGLGDETVQEIVRMMRLTLYTGVAFGVESLQPQETFAGVRSIRAKYTDGFQSWQEGIFMGWAEGAAGMEACYARRS